MTMFEGWLALKHYSPTKAGNKVIYYFTTAGLLFGSGILFYKYLMRKYNTHKNNGIPGPQPRLFVGCTREIMAAGVRVYDTRMVEEYGKVAGIYMGSTPVLIISDLEILKEILVKHFDHFCNRSFRGMPQYPIRKMITLLEFDHWKHVRNSLTPTFTGGKLRMMSSAINDCCRLTLVSRLLPKCEKDEVVEISQVCSKYTMAVIASTTYGIDINSEKDNEQFVAVMSKMMGQGMTTVGRLKIFTAATFPWMIKLFNISFFPKECTDFLFGVFNEALKRKNVERDPTARKNFLDLMTELHIEDPDEGDMRRNGDFVKSSLGYIYSKTELTHEEILAQSFVFFLAGYSTTSTLLSFLLFNLACYPDAQDKVYDEIKEVMGDQMEPSYDLIKKLTYLQMCIDETGRLYPPAFRYDRSCNEDIEINGLKIDKGVVIVMPVYAIHRNPDIWPEPDQFKPERFTPEEKLARHPMAYMPFGLGPRNCIGMRLALMEMKFAIVQMLLNFRLVTCDDTQIPVKLNKNRMMADGGLKIKLVKR